MVPWPQTLPNLTRMGQNLFELIKHQGLVTYESAELRKAIAATIIHENKNGWRLGKVRQSDKVDATIALAMSALASVEQQGTSRDTPHLMVLINANPGVNPRGGFGGSQRIPPQSPFPVRHIPALPTCGALHTPAPIVRRWATS